MNVRRRHIAIFLALIAIVCAAVVIPLTLGTSKKDVSRQNDEQAVTTDGSPVINYAKHAAKSPKKSKKMKDGKKYKKKGKKKKDKKGKGKKYNSSKSPKSGKGKKNKSGKGKKNKSDKDKKKSPKYPKRYI